MGISEDGSFAGSLSGGCIESAVVAEALDALNSGSSRVVRFGSGSPYIDIKLPCGGGLDIHFLPLRGPDIVARCLQAIEARAPFSLILSLASDEAEYSTRHAGAGCIVTEDSVSISHWPEPKLSLIGHGAVVPALAKMARQMDLSVEVLSPDQKLLNGLNGAGLLKGAPSDRRPENGGLSTVRLATPADTAALTADRWTAIIFLFHDHDWEIALMAHAMAQPHFYLGAMGGRKAHTFRTEALGKMGCSQASINAVHAPIGLFHSSRDPDTLALSTLAQVIECYHQQTFRDGE